jgi:hypothetical protein
VNPEANTAVAAAYPIMLFIVRERTPLGRRGREGEKPALAIGLRF